jgi:rhodanese-related sulfurtransferase
LCCFTTISIIGYDWDNDLSGDEERKLKIHSNAFTHWVFVEQGQEPNITANFQHYTSDKLTPHFNEEYTIQNENGQESIIKAFSEVSFSLEHGDDTSLNNLKISKGEESNFIWSIFYSLIEQVVDVLNVPEVEEREKVKLEKLKNVEPGGTIEDLADIELAYAPPFSPAIDLLTTAAWVTQNKLARLAKGYKAKEIKAKLEAGEDFLLLDVRTPKEVEEVRLPYENVVYLPLGKVRSEAKEKLPRDKEIVCFCKLSLRGFEAVRMLVGLGFEKVAFMEGGLAAWPYEKVTK